MGRRGEEFVMEKFVKKYAKIYRTALIENNFSDIDVRVESYVHRRVSFEFFCATE